MYVHNVWALCLHRTERALDPPKQEFQRLWVTLCMLFMEVMPSVEATSALNWWSIFPALVPAFLFAIEEFFKQGEIGVPLERVYCVSSRLRTQKKSFGDRGKWGQISPGKNLSHDVHTLGVLKTLKAAGFNCAYHYRLRIFTYQGILYFLSWYLSWMYK